MKKKEKIKENYNENMMIWILIVGTIISLVVSIVLNITENEYLSSIFSNIFSGMVTGLILAYISAIKNKKKYRINRLKIIYQNIFDDICEFLNDIKIIDNLSEENEYIYSLVYKKFSDLLYIYQYIEKYEVDSYKEGFLKERFLYDFSYNIQVKESEIEKVRENILDYSKEGYKKKMYELVKKYEKDMIKLNAKIKIRINEMQNEISRIEQSFI